MSGRRGTTCLPIHSHSRRQRCCRSILRILVIVLAVAAGVYVGLLLYTIVPWLPIDAFDDAFAPFRDHSEPISVASPDYPHRYLQSVLPVPCHSHNDYWRRTPLYAALGSGCTSVEADVWLLEDDERTLELFVGHTKDTLSKTATLRSMYIDPLVKMLDHMNQATEFTGPTVTPHGVFYQDPNQALSLLIDFKTAGASTLQHVQAQLAPLRDRGWLTTWNGTARSEGLVTIVATGNAPFDLLVANKTHRDIFFDAPLDKLREPSDPNIRLVNSHDFSPFDFKFNPSNSYMASAPFLRALGLNFSFSVAHIRSHPFSGSQTAMVRQQIQDAHIRGLVPRYWGTPRWPRSLRDTVWEVLYDEGIGLLNVDDLRAVRKGHWGGR